MEKISRFAFEIALLYKRHAYKPFPYEGCRTLLKGTGNRFEALIPVLDLYFTAISGFAASADDPALWDDERMATAQSELEKSFFVKYPQYKELEARITPEKTPDLYAEMTLSEELRIKVLHLIALLKANPLELTQTNQEDLDELSEASLSEYNLDNILSALRDEQDVVRQDALYRLRHYVGLVAKETRYDSLTDAEAMVARERNRKEIMQQSPIPEALLRAVEDPSARVRATAALMLGNIRLPEAKEALLRHLRDDPDKRVHSMCAAALKP